MRAAVFYATREGHTQKIAEHIGRDLCAHGIEVGLFDVRTDHRAIHWYHYDRVFVAASVHAERHEPGSVKSSLERVSAGRIGEGSTVASLVECQVMAGAAQTPVEWSGRPTR